MEPFSDEELIEAFGLTEFYNLPDGTVLRNVHSYTRCEGRYCVIHNPSDHHLRHMPLHWRNDAGKFERMCLHGVGHPDPDDLRFRLSLPSGDDGYGVHGCDGCCQPWKPPIEPLGPVAPA